MASSEFDPSFLEQADNSIDASRLEQALRESESLYVSLVETLPVSVLRKDLDGRITFVNNTFCETTNTTADAVMGKTDFDLYPDNLAQKYRSDDERVLQTGDSYDNVEEHKLPDGSVTYVHVFKRPVFNYQGQVTGTEAVFWDVTEEQRAKQAVLTGEVRKRAIFERALDCIVFVDMNNLIVEFNRSAEKAFGYRRREVIGQDMVEVLVPPASRDRFRNNIERYAQSGEVGSLISKRIELQMLRKSGATFFAEMAVQPIPLEGQSSGFAVFLHDVTDRHEAEEKLQHYAEELKRSNQELEQFTAVASHDLHAPLRRVKAFSRMIQDNVKEHINEETDEYFGFINSSVEGMQQLIDGLLSYARVDAMEKHFSPTDCSTVLAKALENLEIVVSEAGATVTHDSLPTVDGDSVQLVQLFQNLIANGIKYCGDELPQVRVAAANKKGAWVFAVKDNGIGIDRENQQAIFDAFKRLHGDGRYSGAGIGLATCKKIVERHGGRIWVESETGKGSVFYFTILE